MLQGACENRGLLGERLSPVDAWYTDVNSKSADKIGVLRGLVP